MEEKCVLFVDDDREALIVYKAYTEKKGYRVFTCADGKEALALLAKTRVDCIVLDVMMPGPDGFAVLPEIRRISEAPVLFLSGKTEVSDRIRGLSLGADDYILKPCSLEELTLRIGLNIRKSDVLRRSSVLEYPPIRIDPQTRKVWSGSGEVILSGREFDLLLMFAGNPGELLTFERIGTELNGSYFSNDRPNIMTAVSRLRKKLKAYAKAGDLVETVWGEGYRFRGRSEGEMNDEEEI